MTAHPSPATAADAAAHIAENPFARDWTPNRIALTFALIAALGAIFVRGMREAVWLAVVIVAIYMVLNVVILANGLRYIGSHAETLAYWRDGLFTQYPNYWMLALAVPCTGALAVIDQPCARPVEPSRASTRDAVAMRMGNSSRRR